MYAQTRAIHTLTDAINNFETTHNLNHNVCNHNITGYKTLCTGGIFATYPKDFLTLGTGFFDQVGSCITTTSVKRRLTPKFIIYSLTLNFQIYDTP